MNIYELNVKTGLRPVYVLLILALLTFLISSCSPQHLIKNKQYLSVTEKKFDQRKHLATGRDSALFSVFKQHLSIKQSEALKFLYAYMPLSDLADYNGDFFLANTNVSLLAQSETKWGKVIPWEIFLHYVLPYRINNENPDSFRIEYFNELMNRVKGMDLKEAALEINHWCHEKVSYQPADDRTSAPMSTILSARGRCGEESTFTVAALRTVGIPARQVYTPRWAHTDDNHAWVEIWDNGKWYYMGACEPEPVLDFGWFTEPARRAMLVHTKSFGASGKSENVINHYDNFTDVNNLAKYAITKRIFVKVIDMDKLPVSNVQVEYQLYNYAEFYPLAVIPTDENGISQFETGLGDLLIWAHKGDKFDFKKISVGETDTLTMQLTLKPLVNNSIDLDLDVPVIQSPLAGPSNELSEKNSERFNQENKIRQKYIESWMKPDEAKSMALKLKTDTSRVDKIIARSMGNYKEICSFLSQTPDSLITRALSLLEILPDKDLRDVKANILSDHLANSSIPANGTGERDVKTFIDYILNPRVANEMLVAWRHYFLTNLPSELVLNAPHNPLLIVQYLNDNIRINEDENYYKTPLTPVGVNELKVSDSGSRAICFVAICRSLGIPSRLEPGRNVPQFLSDNKWTDVYFSDQQRPDPNKGFLKLHSFETNPVPEYYIQFTIARFENGRYNTLEYDFNKKITDFKDELPLPPGHYMLVTGNRLINSKILSSITFFDLAENEHKTIDVKIRKDLSEKKIFGRIDIMKIDSTYKTANISESCSNDKRLVIIWADPEKEPTKHIFNDLLLLKSELDAWGGKFLLFIIGTGKDHSLSVPANTFKPENIKVLPANTSFFIDNQLSVLNNFVKLNKPADMNLPVVIVTDKSGKIYFISTGYRIGIGEQILKYLK